MLNNNSRLIDNRDEVADYTSTVHFYTSKLIIPIEFFVCLNAYKTVFEFSCDNIDKSVNKM